MDKNIILATLTIGYNQSPPNFKFVMSNSKIPLGELLTGAQLLENMGHVYLSFDNNCNDDWALRSCRTDHPIPILVNKDAKFDKLYIKGFINEQYFEITLDSKKSVKKVLGDYNREDDRYINIFKHAKTLVFEIL